MACTYELRFLHDLGKDLGCKMVIFEYISNYHREVVSTYIEIVYSQKVQVGLT